MMAEYEVGESFEDFIGPLGRPSDLLEMNADELKSKHILFVAICLLMVVLNNIKKENRYV